MSEIKKAALYERLNTCQPQAEEAISQFFTIGSVKQNLLGFIAWLKANGVSAQYADYDGQSPFWEVEYNGKPLYIVLIGTDSIRIMMTIDFSNEHQAVMRENNMQDIILNNLHYCSRKDGSNCTNCHLPSGVEGVQNTIFGNEVSNLCCGQFISFDNPSYEVVEGIKKLLGI